MDFRQNIGAAAIPAVGAEDALQATLSRLRADYPGTKDGVLFCVDKLQQNPNSSLRDFRDEAKLHGIPVAGRSLHSAKVLLGMAQPARRRTPGDRHGLSTHRTEPDLEKTTISGPRTQNLEAQLTSALQQIQVKATTQTQRLRKAMEDAIAIMRSALDE